MIDYDLIGSVPDVECYRDELPELIERFRTARHDWLFDAIVDCAAHFYGLDALNYETPEELIDAILGMDQSLEFK